jgi:hypothetical protein
MGITQQSIEGQDAGLCWSNCLFLYLVLSCHLLFRPVEVGWSTYWLGECKGVRFKVLTAAGIMFRIVFWDILPCKMIVDRGMMEAVRTSETSVDNHFTRQYIQEDNSEHNAKGVLKFSFLLTFPLPFTRVIDSIIYYHLFCPLNWPTVSSL